MKYGISFIVIGFNEGWKITKCLQSISDTVKKNNLSNFEIIYVDSGSSDDTISRVKQFSQVNTFLITGAKNAAIARNIGAKEATKNIYFFIDGDMEIIPETLKLIFDEKNGISKDFISGDFENHYYSSTGKFLFNANYHNLTEDRYEETTGGLFLITRELWKKVNGMRNSFKRSQDLDLGLRLSKIGYQLYRIKEILAKHHTVSYYSNRRLWMDIWKGNFLYSKPLLYRSNLSNSIVYRRYLVKEITLYFLILITGLSIYFQNPFIIFGYLLLVLVKAVYKRKTIKDYFLSNYLRFIIFDLGTIFGFFLFWPKQKNLKYIRL